MSTVTTATTKLAAAPSVLVEVAYLSFSLHQPHVSYVFCQDHITELLLLSSYQF